MKNTFPKLPEQDDFLLNLQNSNYSMQTIHNYARDLCIFAVFLHFRSVEFKNATKKDISNYKGYLRAGEHLKDLDKIRGKVIENIGISAKDKGEAASDDLSHGNASGGMNIPLSGSWERSTVRFTVVLEFMENLRMRMQEKIMVWILIA